MKLSILLSILCFTNILSSQSATLSTFEEMWVVGAEFNNFNVDINGLKDQSIFTTESMSGIRTFKDLNKIIADTPFLSLRLGKSEAKIEKESKDYKGPVLYLSQKQNTANKLKGWGSFLVVFEKEGEMVIGIPTKQPENLKKYFEQNSLMISDKKGTFSTMSVKEIRIENGTYGLKK